MTKNKKITSLTDGQRAMMSVWTDKWEKIGLCTDEADWETAKAAIEKCYEDAAIRTAISTAIRDKVDATIRTAVGADVPGRLIEHIFANHYKCFGGQFWEAWSAYESFVMVCDRPQHIRLEDGRLHSANGLAIQWRDGWGLAFWKGLRIPNEWVTGQKPTAREALAQDNVELRRAACEMLGWENILAELDAKVIDHDEDPEHGTLVEVDLPDSPKERFLRVQCATGRKFALKVDNKAKTVLEAQCWVKYRHFNTSDFNYPDLTA